MGKNKIDRVGERFITNEGYEIVIVDYINATNVWIEFQDKYKTIKPCQYVDCVRGYIKNPYHPSVYGVGFIGEGEYKSRIDGKQTDYYMGWSNLLKRGFDEEFKKKHSTYRDVIIEEWLFNFQNYCMWREQNYYEIEGDKMDLDKDILIKGNKVYSRDTMIFVPHRINGLFVKSDASRGDLPIGVHYKKATDRYVAQCKTLEGKKHIGYYNTPEEAFLAYKTFKEAYIKQVADNYKGKIPNRLYEAMYNWKVEIDD